MHWRGRYDATAGAQGPCGGIGRRGRLKICYSQGCGSSSLPGGTIDHNGLAALTRDSLVFK
jgi:hypothetical protein